MIYNIFGILDKNYLEENLDKIKSFKDINNNISFFNSFSLNDIINEISEIVINKNIDENNKCKFLILLSEIDNIKNKNINYDIVLIKLLTEYFMLIN